MKKINPHDRFFKSAMSQPQVATAFFNHHLPLIIRQIADLDTLQLCKESFIDPQLRLSITDILYSVQLGENPGYLYLLTEHQSRPDRWMAFRLLKYIVRIMEHHHKQTGEKQLPLVYPMVIYNGRVKYPYSTDLLDLLDDPNQLAQHILFKPFQLIDLSQIADENLKNDAWLSILELCLKHIFARDILPLVQDLLGALRQVDQAGGDDYLTATFTYLLTAGNTHNTHQLFETIHEHLTPEIEEKFMTIAQQLQEHGHLQGFNQGINQGLNQGRQEEKKRIALKLLSDNFPLDQIMHITGLSRQELLALGIPSSI